MSQLIHTLLARPVSVLLLSPIFSLLLQFVLPSFILGHGVSSSSSGSHRQAFPRCNPGGDGTGSSLQGDVVRDQQNRLSDYQALQRSWFELDRGALAQIDILQRYEALNEDYGELYESHRSCQDVSDRLNETQNQLVDTVQSRNKLS
ncbi:hypothetical protein Tco_0208000, partial [Tanacetum coccineum]